uniref:Uncharacterized protein n=1 Tax=Aegilops tauschii subsp. strangulata TaxID=200361 RepID=A0A453AC05_AEGTS
RTIIHGWTQGLGEYRQLLTCGPEASGVRVSSSAASAFQSQSPPLPLPLRRRQQQHQRGRAKEPTMATIVNTTEEEPMLAVVRSTAELAWADGGAEVADPEVARLCAEAQQHVLAGRWLDMATLM